AGRPPTGPGRAGLRLARLHLTSRRFPVALAAIAVCAAVLRIALHRQWDAYGARQLPLILEAGCAAAIAVASASPFGEPERATGRWLPLLRLGTALALTAGAAGALTIAGIGGHLAGGTLDVLRNLAGLTGLGLLCAVLLGGTLAWSGPTAYLMIAIYALYTQWHGPALTTPWIWPARPAHDVGALLCAGLVFIGGLTAIALRGARDAPDG
ncbi:hypothetical protein ACFQ0D_36330, partial [Micromonospora zhanjiangensis]